MNATLIDIGMVPIPTPTKTYQPVGHYQLVKSIETMANDKFGSKPETESFILARDGKQLFGTLNYKSEEDENSRISIGFRNSYDKSLAVGLVAGQEILVCSNLCFSGDIVNYRKHSSNVMDDLEYMINDLLSKAQLIYNSMLEHQEQMKKDNIDDVLAASLLGQMFINEEILTPTQLNIAKRHWLSGGNGKFPERTAWSLYNSCTEALKISHASEYIDRALTLDNFFVSHLE